MTLIAEEKRCSVCGRPMHVTSVRLFAKPNTGANRALVVETTHRCTRTKACELVGPYTHYADALQKSPPSILDAEGEPIR